MTQEERRGIAWTWRRTLPLVRAIQGLTGSPILPTSSANFTLLVV